MILWTTSRFLLRCYCQISTFIRKCPANTSPQTTQAIGQGLTWKNFWRISTQSGVVKDLTSNISVILIEYAILRNNYVWVPIFIFYCHVPKQSQSLVISPQSIFFCQSPSSVHLERSSGIVLSLPFIHSSPLIYGAPTMGQTLFSLQIPRALLLALPSWPVTRTGLPGH